MSCLLRPFATIGDIEEVKRFLYKKDYPVGREWLQECSLSVSSMGDHLVIAHKRYMVILKSKWDSHEEVKMKYHPSVYLQVGDDNDDVVTAVLCLPLFAHGKSFHCGPDWTCIAVGFSSGYVRFYTEMGNLLAQEILHTDPVIHLKCQSYEMTRSSTAQEQTEEVYVMYKSVLCVLGGFGLFQTLRACRSQVARAKANCGDVVPAPPLIYKKWGFQDQAVITDCEMAGLATSNTFNHLMTTSLCQDFGAYYRSGAPQMSLVVAVGRKPFVGFHYAMEGGAPPPFKDMAMAVASKLKSAIGQAVPGWFSSTKKTNGSDKNKDKVVTEPVEPMLCRFGLCDALRFGDRVVMSPNKTLSAVSDGLGRVLLIDNQKGIALRMWKGYRNAQCGWLEVQEDAHKREQARTALFLVIYSPNMNCIDIWALQHGSRVASFSADDTKYGRLLYIGYGFLGLNNVLLKDGNRSQLPVVFIDPCGSLKEIVVPFHFALSAKDSKRTRDIHLLKEMKRFIKSGDHEEEEIVQEVQRTVSELQTVEVQIQTIETLASSRYTLPKALLTAVEVCKHKLTEKNRDIQSIDASSKTLLYMCERLEKLLRFYNFVQEEHQKPPKYSTVVPDHKSAQNLSNLLHAPEREVNNLLNLMNTIETVSGKSQSEARVAFRHDSRSAFVEFVSCFEIGNHISNESQMIDLKKNVSEDKIQSISELMYQGTLYSDTSLDDWKEYAHESGIQPLELMRLALHFWLHKRGGSSIEAEMLRFTALLKVICSLADVDIICAEYNELSSWWREVRRVLMDSANPFMALTGAIICRAVALSLEKDKEMKHLASSKNKNSSENDNCNDSDGCQDMSVTPDDETHSSVSEWENVSRDTCQWTLLIGQLEDLALLDTVLKQKPWPGGEEPPVVLATTGRPHMCHLPYKRLSISLSDILKNGKGSVSELVARWLSCAGLDPRRLIDLSDIEFDNMEQQEGEHDNSPSHRQRLVSVGITEGEKLDVEEGAEACLMNEHHTHTLDLLALLKHHFPYSLSSSVLLANLCWEYMFAWHQSPDKLEALEAGIACLQVVPSPQMKHGLCSLVWSTHLKHRFEAAANLLHKAGKVPKERLCVQEIGISDLQLPMFLDSCLQFLDTFMDATVASGEGRSLSVLRYEELWDCESGGPRPLAEMALAQPPVSAPLLHLHCQLAMALHMMASFSVKITRPLSALFDGVAQAAFFADLTSNPQLPGHNPGAKLKSSRSQFLLRVVRAAVQTVRGVDCPGAGLDARQANQWMSKCHLLADVWGIDGDVLRRQQVCELYANGFDHLAEEVVPAVSDSTSLASQLLVIVGQRVKHMLENSDNFREWVSRLSPSLYHWLKSLNEGVSPCFLWSSEDTTQLLALVLQYLPEGNNEYQLALHMLDAMSIMNEEDDNARS
ncbi:hypothetical protein R5R35_008896 [Gryllus longicercus]|uniref:Rab3 GTPase-activating protein non-catalytic subunit n=1 Tax=Gryllus longicercus TaxID=2509291 RepID=A0AAN9VER4_9ORTH